MTEEHDDLSQSRRKFLKNTGVFAGGVLGGSVLGGLLTNQFMTLYISVILGFKYSIIYICVSISSHSLYCNVV